MLSFIMYKAVKSDLACRMIPDECSLAICIMAVGLGGFTIQRLCAALAIMLFTALFMGFGDAKLFASLCLLMGSSVISVIVCAFMLSFAYCSAALIISLLSGKHLLSLKDSIPFAPFIAVPAISIFISDFLVSAGGFV